MPRSADTIAPPTAIDPIRSPAARPSLDIVESCPAGDSSGDTGRPAVSKWFDRRGGRGRHASVGIECDGTRLVLVGLRRAGRSQTIDSFLAAEFPQTPSKKEIGSLLREFDPARGVRVQVAITASRGVVRQFILPPLRKGQRLAAALWEGQKLVPFPLKTEDTLYAFSFAPGPANSWQVTLVALPRTDAVDILAAIEDVGWILQSVSVSGAHRVAGLRGAHSESSAASATAVALWTPHRGAFMVFRDGQLQFQYDLGSPPKMLPTNSQAQEVIPRLVAGWIKDMGRAIGDALEFYLGAYPQFAPEQLELMGLPMAAAPLITDWQDRFGLPVAVVDALERFLGGVPDRVAEWIRTNSCALTAAALAASGRPAIDLTPPALVAARRQRVSNGIARGAFILSVAAILSLTGLLWMRTNLATRSAAEAQLELQELQSSSPAKDIKRAAGLLRDIQNAGAEATKRPQEWMPWAKSITSTIPAGVELASFDLELPENMLPGVSLPVARLAGRLDPSDRAHSLIYADWINRLDQFAGTGKARLVSSRAMDWRGQRASAFTLEVYPPGTAERTTK